MTQQEKILNYMKRYGSITPLDAMREFGCMRLAARIADLAKNGVPIKREMVKSRNVDGDTVRFARYSLAQ